MGNSGWDLGQCGHYLVAFDNEMNRIGVGSIVDRCAYCAGHAEPRFQLRIQKVLVGGVPVSAWMPAHFDGNEADG